MEWFKTFFGEDYLKFDVHEDTRGEVDFLEAKLDLPASARILDLCCGYGRHAVELAKRGYKVTGYDLSPILLKVARRRSRTEHVDIDLICGDIRNLWFEEKFDGIISMFTSFGYFEDEAVDFDIFKLMGRALTPDGTLLLEAANRDFVVKHFYPVEWFKYGKMVVLERRSFDIVTGMSNVEVTVVEGNRERKYRHSVRLYCFTELKMLMNSAGLRTTDVWGDFKEGEYSWDSLSMIIRANKVQD